MIYFGVKQDCGLKWNTKKMKLFMFLIIVGVLGAVYITQKLHAGTISFTHYENIHDFSDSFNSITPISNSSHFAVSAFVDHRFNKAIRVIGIIKRDSVQPLYCVYCNKDQRCELTTTQTEIHTDHFGFPFGASDLLCQGKHTQNATHITILADANKQQASINNLNFLPIKNRENKESFKYNFTVCISNLFGDYNNVLQFAQSMEMYKLLGVQRVVIYNTSCGSNLEKLLQHHEKEGILEIVPWPIGQFLHPSAGWNPSIHGGDIQYYGQLVTLNECVYRQMYQSKYVLLNDIDEIIMPYKYANLALLMEALQQEQETASVFLIENHIFPKTQFEASAKFRRPEWKRIPGINIMEHIYREPDRKNIFNPTKMIINPRKMVQTSVHSSLKHFGDVHHVPPDVCRIVHVRTPLQGHLTKEQLIVDTRVWDFEQELIPNVNRALQLSGLLQSQE